jgi:hypothetical protein
MPTHLRHLLLVVLLAAPAATHAATRARELTSCINAAGCINGYWGPGQEAAGFGLTAFRPGQTFTPSISGLLTTVDLGLETITGGTVNAVAEIRPTINGVPTATILAEAIVPGAPYAGGVLHTADFAPSHVVLVAGTRYAVTLRCTSHQYILAAFPACSSTTGANDYVSSEDNGQTWAVLSPRDRSFIFEVCMDAVTSVRAGTWGQLKAIYR